MRDVGDAIPYKSNRTLQPQNRFCYVNYMLNNAITEKILELIYKTVYN